MGQYLFSETNFNIFELNTQPRIVYLQDITSAQFTGAKALHAHQDLAELMVVEGGSNTCTIGNRSYTIEAGHILLINAGQLHCTYDTAGSKFQACLIGIRNLHLRGLEAGQLASLRVCPVLHAAGRAPLLQQYCAILRTLAADGKDKDQSAAANQILRAMLFTVTSIVKTSKTLLEGQDYNLGLRIKEFIDEHYLEDIKLANIAEALHVNAYYLSHTFKKILGYSPIQYMIHRRIGEAQNLLINTTLTVTEIALRCGYNNSNYFQVVFNTIVGMPPGKYRKAWRV